MKKIIPGILLVFLAFTACKKTENSCNENTCLNPAPATEVTQLETYLSGAGITTAVKHCSGLYYQITAQGVGSTPTTCSYVTVNYKGTLTNGTVFDQTTTSPASFTLANLIAGWKKGIPLIQKGGKIRLYLPPSLGYGSSSNATIPANSILIFDIELVDVQ